MKTLDIKIRKTPLSLKYGVILFLAIGGFTLGIFNMNNNCINAAVNPNEFCAAVTIGIQNQGLEKNYPPVRVPFVSESLENQNYINNFGSQVEIADSTFESISFMNQELNSNTSAGWWIVPPILPSQTRTNLNMYLGSDSPTWESWRDNGFYFYTNDLVTVPNSVNFNITDNLSLEADVMITNLNAWTCPTGTPAADTGFIIDRWDSDSGFAFGVECEEQTLYNFAQFEGTKVRSVVTTGYNTRYNLKAEYINPNINLYVDDVLKNTGTSGSLTTNNTDLTIGNNLNSTWVLNTQLSKNITSTNDIELRFNFDANDMNETDGTTYLGTVADVSGNDHNGVYSMDRPQTDYQLNISTFRTGIQNFVTNPELDKNIVSSGLNMESPANENNFLPFYSLLNNAASTMGVPRQMLFAGVFTIISMITASVVLLATKAVPLAIGTYGVVMAFGFVNGFYDYWVAMAVVALLIMVYTSSKYMESNF